MGAKMVYPPGYSIVCMGNTLFRDTARPVKHPRLQNGLHYSKEGPYKFLKTIIIPSSPHHL